MASGGATAMVDVVELRGAKAAAEKPKKGTRKNPAKSKPPGSKGPKVLMPGTKYENEASRQEKLNYAQRTVWANLQGIINSAIQQSLKQNYTAAKFLCEFAGVFAASDQEAGSPEASTNGTRDADPMRQFLAEVAETVGQ